MKVFKTIVCVILALMVFVCTLGGTSMLAARRIVSEPDRIAELVCDESYDTAICETVRNEVDRAKLLLSLSEDIFEKNVSDAEIVESAHAAFKAVMRRVLDGDEAPLPEFESFALLEAIRADIAAYAAEHDLQAEDGSAEEVYDYIRMRVNAQLRIVNESYLEKVPDLSPVQKAFSFWFVPMIVAAVCAALIFVIRRKELVRALNTVTVPVYSAALLGFVISRVLTVKDYVSKVSLDQSMLREALIRIYRVTVGSFEKCFGIALIAAVVLLVCDIALVARFGYTKAAPKKTEPAAPETSEAPKAREVPETSKTPETPEE